MMDDPKTTLLVTFSKIFLYIFFSNLVFAALLDVFFMHLVLQIGILLYYIAKPPQTIFTHILTQKYSEHLYTNYLN